MKMFKREIDADAHERGAIKLCPFGITLTMIDDHMRMHLHISFVRLDEVYTFFRLQSILFHGVLSQSN